MPESSRITVPGERLILYLLVGSWVTVAYDGSGASRVDAGDKDALVRPQTHDSPRIGPNRSKRANRRVI